MFRKLFYMSIGALIISIVALASVVFMPNLEANDATETHEIKCNKLELVNFKGETTMLLAGNGYLMRVQSPYNHDEFAAAILGGVLTCRAIYIANEENEPRILLRASDDDYGEIILIGKDGKEGRHIKIK